LSCHAFFSPAGITPIRNRPRDGITLNKLNYSLYLNGQHPDSVVLVFSYPIAFYWSDTTQSAEFSFPSVDRYQCRHTENSYLTNPSFNAQLVAKLIENAQATAFRCFYFDAASGVTRYADITLQGKMIREAQLTDDHNIRVRRFYRTETPLSTTLYTMGRPDSLSRRIQDTLWYGFHAPLVRNGREDVYYANGVLRITRWYHRGVLDDNTYVEYNPDSSIKRKYTTKNGQISETSGAVKNYDPHHKALLFAIDRFKCGLATLSGCVNDAQQIRETLITYRNFGPENVDILADRNLTHEHVEAALRKLLQNVKKGDDIFIHFSGHGIKGGPQQFVIPFWACLLPIPGIDSTGLDSTECISQSELEHWLTLIKNRLGPEGQLVLSLDVSYAGAILSNADTAGDTRNSIISRGENSNILFSLVRNQQAPVIILTACSKDQHGFEISGADGKSHGVYSYALCDALANPAILNSSELFDEINNVIAQKETPQTPGYLASETQFLFEHDNSVAEPAANEAVLPSLTVKGNVFSVSIGISDYHSTGHNSLRFANCEADARAYDEFFKNQFSDFPASAAKLYRSSLLVNHGATKDSILAAINNAISNSKPDDYFIFNFSGYCKPLRDSAGRQVTWFIPYGLNDISDTAEIRKKGIPLDKLKDLLQLIPANNQLFITEAGATNNFQQEFIQALIETSPTIAALSAKNRIFIVPNSSGLDQFACNNVVWQHGPVNYYLTHLPDDLNIFGLFEGGIYADAVKFALNKTEVNCNFFRTGYFSIFFEKDFIDNLHYFLPEDVMQSRGAIVISKDKEAVARSIARRYALIVGTDRYAGKPDWPDLNNPAWDAREVARELRTNYGFETDTLINEPADSIYSAILALSGRLRPNDQLLVYIAGHGDFDERLFDDGFIVCANSQPVRADPYRNSYIQYSKLSRMINKLPARQVLMVLDVCFGGTFDERVARAQSRAHADTYEDATAQQFITEKLKKMTRLYLTSGGKREVPDGYRGSHSPFAQRLLQALQTRGGRGGLLTATDFYQFVKKLPSGPLIGSFGDDEPGSDFILLANTTINQP
jgi:Caspase domain